MKKKNWIEVLTGAMLAVVVGLMPLVVRVTTRPLPPELLDYFSPENEGLYLDMFAYWKGFFVLIPAVVIAFFCVSDWITRGKMPDFKEIFRQPHMILSAGYLLAVIVSAIASPYTFTAWFGTYARSEGAFMWLAYFVIFFAAIHYSREITNARVVLYALAFSSIIMGAVGVTQFIGRDIFDTDFGRWVITAGDSRWTEQIYNDYGELVPRRSFINTVFTIAHGTLFNPNTFGKYTAMLSPILLLAALTYDGKKYVNAIFLLAGGLMLLGVFGSSSLGGLVGIATAAAVLAVTFALGRGIPWKRLLVAATPVVAVLVLAILLVPPLNYRVNFLFGRLGDAMRAETAAINDYIFEENTMTVYGADGEIFSLTVHGMTGNWLTVADSHGNEIAPASRIAPPIVPGEQVIEPVEYIFDIPDYRAVWIRKLPDLFLYQHASGTSFLLSLADGDIVAISGQGAIIDLQEEIPAWGFAGRETWGSNRGYIWSRSFPLMFTPRALTVGHGPDTYINVFPSFEPVARQRFFQQPYIMVDKAHNLVLQTWISTGALSAILLLGLFGHYLVTTFISLVKSKGEPVFSYGLRLGLLCGVAAYVASSMATDTTIGSTGVFFVLLGVGYGLNARVKKNA